jgi:hypothetical protein
VLEPSEVRHGVVVGFQQYALQQESGEKAAIRRGFMIVWWFERVVSTYHVAGEEGVEIASPRICVCDAIA